MGTVAELVQKMVQRLCAVHLKNHSDIEDIFQTVFLKYLLYPEEFTLEGKNYDDAIEELLKSKKFKVYQGKDNDLTFSVVSKNKDKIINRVHVSSEKLINQKEMDKAIVDARDERGPGHYKKTL